MSLDLDPQNDPTPPAAVDGSAPQPPRRKKYVPAVGPGLKKLLLVVITLFTILAVNSAYLSAMTFAEWWRGIAIKDAFFYISMFLLHVVVGLVFILPAVIFGILHIRNAYTRPNRRAVRAGLALFASVLVLIITGVLLTRIEGFIELKSPTTRTIVYWTHVIAPLAAAWLFILHRLAGKKIKWRVGLAFAGVGAAFAVGMVVWAAQDPRRSEMGPKSGEKYFFPSLARTATGNFIPADVLMMDDYCAKCHADIHKTWAHSAHRFSSFNNPAYLFSVKGTRKAMMERDGNVQGSRFCAGCHDPVPFYSGAFDDPKFDDPNYKLEDDALAQAGITCTTCHAITAINSVRGKAVRGNADYTIEEPIHYPFAFSKNPFLQWVNNQLIKAKPEVHKRTFLKPEVHRTPEFCGTCHKVHLPPELNAYKWLRGQNHYDAYHLSGVSGHGIVSFYYPPKATHDCVSGSCHMPLLASNDFGARDFDGTGTLKVHSHQFPSANTALPHLLKMPDWVIENHKKFNEGVMRIDLFGLREGGGIDGKLIAPLRPTVPELAVGSTYLLELVIRTVKMGHLFTQGTADSNEVWVDVTLRSGDRVIGRSGARGDDGGVDPWSHFVNVYMLDRRGNRIDRRNAEDIFVPLYNHQIGPGAADVVHYGFRVPDGLTEPITIEAKLNYRKFDTTYMQHVYGKDYKNDLPVMTLAQDTVVLPVAGVTTTLPAQASAIDLWQRWNDYGIGCQFTLTGKAARGELRQAEEAFYEVEKLGKPDGPLNRARVYLIEGRLPEAKEALNLAGERGAPPWSVAWFTGQVNHQNGNLDEAIENYTTVIANGFPGVQERGFDFSQDYTVRIQLGEVLFQRGRRHKGSDASEARERDLRAAAEQFEKALDHDPENGVAHYNLALIYDDLGDAAKADVHRADHLKYKMDDNAADFALSEHRRKNPAANHAAETIVIYDLQRSE